MNDPDKPTPPPSPSDGDRGALKLIRSQEILGDAEEVLIEHDGQTYRLRLTRSGKLILHK